MSFTRIFIQFSYVYSFIHSSHLYVHAEFARALIHTVFAQNSCTFLYIQLNMLRTCIHSNRFKNGIGDVFEPSLYLYSLFYYSLKLSLANFGTFTL